MPFEYRGDIAAADIAFDAWAETLDELFQEAARATMQVMVEDLSAVRRTERVEVKLSQSSEEMLLFDFLNELIFYKDARRLILVPGELRIDQTGEEWTLQATLQGEAVNPEAPAENGREGGDHAQIQGGEGPGGVALHGGAGRMIAEF